MGQSLALDMFVLDFTCITPFPNEVDLSMQ